MKGWMGGVRFGIVEDDSLVWGDPLYPFPVYGVGVVVCAVVLLPLKTRLVAKRRTVAGAGLRFCAVTVLACMGMEPTMGFMLNRPDAAGSIPCEAIRGCP